MNGANQRHILLTCTLFCRKECRQFVSQQKVTFKKKFAPTVISVVIWNWKPICKIKCLQGMCVLTCVIVKEANVSVFVGSDGERQCRVTDHAVHLTRATHVYNNHTVHSPHGATTSAQLTQFI